jgi:hypothetical protein
MTELDDQFDVVDNEGLSVGNGWSKDPVTDLSSGWEEDE